MDDLAAWLTEIWDEAEKAARFTIELTEHSYPADEFQIHWGWARLANHRTSGAGGASLAGGGASMALGAPSPSEVIARIAADRQILVLATRVITEAPPRGYDWESEYTRARAGAYERVIRLLALPYADRPGYQEAWKPE